MMPRSTLSRHGQALSQEPSPCNLPRVSIERFPYDSVPMMKGAS